MSVGQNLDPIKPSFPTSNRLMNPSNFDNTSITSYILNTEYSQQGNTFLRESGSTQSIFHLIRSLQISTNHEFFSPSFDDTTLRCGRCGNHDDNHHEHNHIGIYNRTNSDDSHHHNTFASTDSRSYYYYYSTATTTRTAIHVYRCLCRCDCDDWIFFHHSRQRNFWIYGTSYGRKLIRFFSYY